MSRRVMDFHPLRLRAEAAHPAALWNLPSILCFGRQVEGGALLTGIVGVVGWEKSLFGFKSPRFFCSEDDGKKVFSLNLQQSSGVYRGSKAQAG